MSYSYAWNFFPRHVPANNSVRIFLCKTFQLICRNTFLQTRRETLKQLNVQHTPRRKHLWSNLGKVVNPVV